MAKAVYLDTSVVLRAILESGPDPETAQRIAEADLLITSRLSLVEATRAILRARQDGRLTDTAVADAERELDAVWSRCAIWELTAAVCEHAGRVAPERRLRTLDALHLATFLAARRHFEGVTLATADARLAAAAR